MSQNLNPGTNEPQRIASRDNPLLVKLRKLTQDPGAYRKLGLVWLEGDHLCRALLARGQRPAQAVVSESGWLQPALRELAAAAPRAVVVPDALFAALSALAWNFLFIPPRFTLHIAKVEDALTFATYFIIAITVGSLTAQLKAREHLAAQVQLAQNSERLRKTLLDCVSHELKTPLAAIGAMTPIVPCASAA